MRPPRGPAALAMVFGSVTLTTCVFPTERDDSVRVTVDPLPVLIRGTDTYATARAWRIVAAGDSQPIANVSFVWSSGDPLTATVDANGHVVGIKSGRTAIRAAAANFDKRATVGQITLRVSGPLEIDSIRPQTVKYGETVTIYGVGVDSLFQVTLGQGVLIPYFFSNTRDAAGYARNSFWVPPPAHSDSMFFIGNGAFGFSRDTVRPTRPISSGGTRGRSGRSPIPVTARRSAPRRRRRNRRSWRSTTLPTRPSTQSRCTRGRAGTHLPWWRATPSATSGFSETRTRRTTSATRRTRSRFCSATSLTGPTWTRSRSRTPTTWTGFGSTSPAQAPSRSASGPPPGRSPQWTRATSICTYSTCRLRETR